MDAKVTEMEESGLIYHWVDGGGTHRAGKNQESNWAGGCHLGQRGSSLAAGKAWGKQTFMRKRDRACKDLGGKLANIQLQALTHKTGSSNLLLLLSRFSRVRRCVTPEMAAHQAPPSQGFSRQEQWSWLPFPSPMHESEK